MFEIQLYLQTEELKLFKVSNQVQLISKIKLKLA